MNEWISFHFISFHFISFHFMFFFISIIWIYIIFLSLTVKFRRSHFSRQRKTSRPKTKMTRFIRENPSTKSKKMKYSIFINKLLLIFINIILWFYDFRHGREKSEEVVFLDKEKQADRRRKWLDLFEKTRRKNRKKWNILYLLTNC